MSTATPPLGRDFLLPNPVLGALLLTLAAVLAPHLLRIPPWLSATVVLIGLWRLRLALRGEPLPPAWLRILLTVLMTLGVYLSYGSILGRDAGTALLSAMTALKLLEMRRPRDTQVLLYLALFLIVTQFLYSQSLLTAGYMMLVAWAVTTLLVSTGRPTPTRDLRRQARLSLTLLLQALPIMLILFVLFPRIAGPLWGLPEDAYAGTTGLSDSMSPGSISQLSQSDAVAFRASFEGEPPPHAARYWRGLVFANYDGRSWRPGEVPPTPPALLGTGRPSRYTVTLQPHDQRWLFALDLPGDTPAGSALNAHYELRSDEPVRELTAYRMHSWLDYRLAPSAAERHLDRYRELPPGAHPQARALAGQWRAQSDNDGQIVRLAEQWFRQREFHYTLTPPRLPDDPVDEFLFDTRRGFCEHYAGAFAVLMRAAGVPARIVTGYQGGEPHPSGDYMIVRQSDAHAWAEVWLEGRGWVRVDPTGFVAPDRVEWGLGEALGAGEPVPAMARGDGGLLRRFRLQLDLLDNRWNQWVIAYGPRLQRQLLGRVGLDDWRRMAGALALLLGGTLLLLGLYLLHERRRQPRDPSLRLYQRYCRKLARGGLPPHPSEGPRDYAHRVSAARPELAARVQQITELYCALRYRSESSSPRLAELRREVDAFKPGGPQ
ncbi:DUF3488 and DUF4129 domain-containing transglutaminase family protein [Alkalilimnicola sp. S0819]|uniref:transglutaminase TgpA family protein n=1 Tax=Alkalilimnicola sp. S0819 TaxID=2613922 RepID=UPI00126224EC|nr:DUF3488 and transglutaminase-like domain-containing protein [Alkalilimnicola sp. S0819]KAB7619761.1 DUF3488 domain-containing protein [Alkalilimnicola sp. S0819]MPQ17525.1 DUF3488 domain-containing protein [Alkalilimnicola sp. S0819]